MSNHFAVATVSAALREVVLTATQGSLTGVQIDVETQRPDRFTVADGAAGASVFLYQVSPNAAWRNADLATRRSDGSLACTPQAALDLYYLLTFFGNELTQQPETLLGSTVATLHSRPLLSRAQIQATIAANGHLAASDLDQQVELVRFVPLSLNLEELSKLWSVFFQTAYRLSVAYQASVVLVEPEEAPPQPTLPVAQRVISVETLKIPNLTSAGPPPGTEALLPGGTLVIEGRALRGETTVVHLGDAEAEPAAEDVTDSRISLSLAEPPFAAATLRAGLLPLRVSHPRLLGPEGQQTLHAGPASNVLPVLLRPEIRPNGGNTGPDVVQAIDGDGDPALTVTADPEIGADQQVRLLLNGAGGSFNLPAEPRENDGNSAVFKITDVDPGEYLLRLQVDNADSLLTQDGSGAYVGPAFTVT